MERQLLVSLLLCLLASCQTTNISTPTETDNNSTPSFTVDEIKQPLEVKPPEDIWEYIVNKSLQDSELVL